MGYRQPYRLREKYLVYRYASLYPDVLALRYYNQRVLSGS